MHTLLQSLSPRQSNEVAQAPPASRGASITDLSTSTIAIGGTFRLSNISAETVITAGLPSTASVSEQGT